MVDIKASYSKLCKCSCCTGSKIDAGQFSKLLLAISVQTVFKMFLMCMALAKLE